MGNVVIGESAAYDWCAKCNQYVSLRNFHHQTKDKKILCLTCYVDEKVEEKKKDD